MTLQHFDLNLLRVLEALLDEQSVTRAAKRLSRSQPTVSNSLSRLRKILNDELLVATGKGMILTPRAEALRSSVREVLALTGRSLFHEVPFDPKAATGTVRVSMPDRLTLAVLPPLREAIQKSAPAIDIQIITAAQREAIALLDEGATDAALGFFDRIPQHCRSELLLSEPIYCVFRRNHPITRMRFTIDAVLSFPHLVVTARGRTSAMFDDLIARRGKRRHTHLTVSNFSAVPELLATSEMIGVFTQLAANAFSSSYKLSTRPVPIDVGPISTLLVWHVRNDRDQRHIWLRRQIRNVQASLTD